MECLHGVCEALRDSLALRRFLRTVGYSANGVGWGEDRLLTNHFVVDWLVAPQAHVCGRSIFMSFCSNSRRLSRRLPSSAAGSTLQILRWSSLTWMFIFLRTLNTPPAFEPLHFFISFACAAQPPRKGFAISSALGKLRLFRAVREDKAVSLLHIAILAAAGAEAGS